MLSWRRRLCPHKPILHPFPSNWDEHPFVGRRAHQSGCRSSTQEWSSQFRPLRHQTDGHALCWTFFLFFFFTLPVIHHPPWFKADPKTETKRIPDNDHVLAASRVLSEPESRKKVLSPK